jgi:archaellum component FlaC
MAKTLTVYLAADLKKFNSGMDQAGKKAQGFSGTLKNMLGPALIGAGIAAGAFALKLATDGVQAAIEDEKAVASLANTLGNLNLAHDTAQVEAYIYQLERAYGVADTDLRPAYERLVRSTRNTEDANRALKIAMDISAATGKSLSSVSDQLGKAYDGQVEGLSRLGVGLDRTQLKTMSLDDIMTTLANNFSGAADVAAQTLEGRLARLTTATDNLKEAFGAGLLQALQDTNDETQKLVDNMESAESSIRVAGYNIGQALEQAVLEATELSKVLGFFTDPGATINYIFEDIAIDLRGLSDEAKEAARQANALRYELSLMPSDFDKGTFAGGDFAETYTGINFELKAANEYYRDAAVRLDRLNNETSEAADETNDYKRATGGAARATDELTKKQKNLVEAYEAQGIAFATSREELLEGIRVLDDATRAVEEYANTIQDDLLEAFDLVGLYDAAKESGGDLAENMEEGLKTAFDHMEWGGNVLNALKAANVPQGLIEYLSSIGPEGGWELGQAMLSDDGLKGSIESGWTKIQDKTRELALDLVPEFLEAGRLGAIAKLDGLAMQFAEDQRKFKRLGNKLGQQVGDSFSERMLKEVADAVRQVEALATAARAEKVAAAQAEQSRITEQAVATAISQLIRNSDQRSGRNVQPVL